MNRTRVKICGVTRLEDAWLASELGADAVGIVMTPNSPRCVSLEQARAIIDAVQPDRVQFHGSEDATFCEGFGVRYIKAVGMDGDVDVRKVASGHPRAVGFVLDGHPPGQQGGRGKTFDWSRIPRDLDRPILLAGGLNPSNVGDAIRTVRPWAVDLASGVESSPGIKDAGKLRAFFAAVRAADVEIA